MPTPTQVIAVLNDIVLNCCNAATVFILCLTSVYSVVTLDTASLLK